MEYVALDFETTGLEPASDRVIEVGAVSFTPEEVFGTLSRLANPGRSVPIQVLRLTGIQRAELDVAAPWEEVLLELADFLSGRQLVGHGTRLEVGFLKAAGLLPEGAEFLDTLDLARILLPHASSYSLPLLVGELGLNQPRAHRALDDADATRQLLLYLGAEAARLSPKLAAALLAIVQPYSWPLADFFRWALRETPASTDRPPPEGARSSSKSVLASPATIPDDPEQLVELIGPSGPLARALPGYEQRAGQVEMLRAVAQIMQRGGTLVVEAGTGTGKSLAYLIPAAARARASGERVVVTTHTHTLQEQLMEKDIPWLQAWLPFNFQVALLKGRSNYLSLRRWRHYLDEPCREVEELGFRLKILLWLSRTESGDRAELRLQGKEFGYWSQVASDPLDCIGVHCHSGNCFVHRAREQAEQADVVVVNHALLMADAAAEGGLLPSFEHLVVDEAHHLEAAATEGLRRELEEGGLVGRLERLVSSGRSVGLLSNLLRQGRLDDSGQALSEAEKLAPRSHQLAVALFAATATWVKVMLRAEGGGDNLRLTPRLRENAKWAELTAAAVDTCTALAALCAELRRATSLSREWMGGEAPDQRLRELEIIRGQLEEDELLLRELFNQPSEGYVYWFQLTRNGTVGLRSAPIEVGPLIQEQILSPRSSVVLTSASLSIAGRFDFFRHRSGISETAHCLAVSSPFDYLKQALICLPTDMPDPSAGDFEPRLGAVIADVAGRLVGRTLVLFTSHRQLRDVYEELKQRRDLDDVLILGQGLDGPRGHLLSTFRAASRSVLLGTTSFWEGIDLPGDQLSCVMVVRLPFPVPSEPVYAARAERLRDSFSQYALPLAVLRLKQGFGRLIRRGDDRGAVVILDGRILGRGYGRTFLEALPPASRSIGPAVQIGAEIERWMAMAVEHS
ncbi:MAG: helicase C-terminal domain-containing protein [Candidatus Dormibacteraceae bacterium]